MISEGWWDRTFPWHRLRYERLPLTSYGRAGHLPTVTDPTKWVPSVLLTSDLFVD